MHIQQLIVTLLHFSYVTSANYHGCIACLGQDEQTIQASCQDHCNKAFKDGTGEHGHCLNGCNIFVRQHHCCVEGNACSPDADTCLKNYFNPPKSLRSRKKRSLPLLENPKPDITALVPYSGGSELEARDLIDGETCCLFAQTFLDVSYAKVIRFMNGFILTKDAFVGLSFLAFGLAANHACNKMFNHPCTFSTRGDDSSSSAVVPEAPPPRIIMGKPPAPPKDV